MQPQGVDSAGFTSATHLYKTKGTGPRAVTSHSSAANQLKNQLRYMRYLNHKYFQRKGLLNYFLQRLQLKPWRSSRHSIRGPVTPCCSKGTAHRLPRGLRSSPGDGAQHPPPVGNFPPPLRRPPQIDPSQIAKRFDPCKFIFIAVWRKIPQTSRCSAGGDQTPTCLVSGRPGCPCFPSNPFGVTQGIRLTHVQVSVSLHQSSTP